MLSKSLKKLKARCTIIFKVDLTKIIQVKQLCNQNNQRQKRLFYDAISAVYICTLIVHQMLFTPSSFY